MDTQAFIKAQDAVLAYYDGNNYSKKRIKVVRYTMATIAKMVLEDGLELDSSFIAKAKAKKRKSACYWISFCHVVGMLHLAMEGKELGYKMFSSTQQNLMPSTKEFSELLTAYLVYQRKLGKTIQTVAYERWANFRLLQYLEHIGISRSKDITIGHLQGYLVQRIPSLARSTGQAVLVRNRRFFAYLVKKGCVAAKLLPVFDCRIAIPEHVVTTLTKSQAAAIYAAPTSHTAVQARTTAILLCSLILGLRKSDVHALQFSAIDWKRERIQLIQKKTRTPLTIPLPCVVGKAIATYIMDFRPHSDSPYIFLSCTAPYRPIVGSTTVLKDFLTGTPEPLPCGGYHILRRTCASYLLAHGTEPSLIMHLLGQTSMASLDRYLSLDASTMVLSALNAPAIGIPEVLR